MIPLLLALGALAADPPAVVAVPALPAPPELVPPVEGECAREYDLVAGRPVPPGLVDARGLVTCHATAIPPSVALQAVTEAQALGPTRELYTTSTDLLHRDALYWRDRATVREPWYERPAVQRWAGRGETLIAVVLAIVVLDAATDRR